MVNIAKQNITTFSVSPKHLLLHQIPGLIVFTLAPRLPHRTASPSPVTSSLVLKPGRHREGIQPTSSLGSSKGIGQNRRSKVRFFNQSPAR